MLAAIVVQRRLESIKINKKPAQVSLSGLL
ncbi:hypothetical protein L585_17590 [Pantoea ananatis BRT175]|nr:hypothetical protein L585_17590 [Pantoea ananatis BRT175]PKC42747.1 hypothetical protein V461_13330 [Pantoea ananatis BRT98]